MKEIKTNAMRILDKAKVIYTAHHYEPEEGKVDGIYVADKLGCPHEIVYKTLVTVAPSREHYVFVIPIAEEVDLKAAAKAAGEKSVEMIPVKDITSVTGYVRGGCSPLGMKKQFPTFVHETAASFDKIYISGGRIGTTIVLNPADLMKVINGTYADLTR